MKPSRHLSFLFLGLNLLISTTVLAKRHLDLSAFSIETKKGILEKIPNLADDEKWTSADLDQLIRHLVQHEQYDSARVVLEPGDAYRISVGKIRRISHLDFLGLSAFSEGEIRRETGLAEKQPFDPNLMIEAGEKIRQLYEVLGYPKTVVDIEYLDAKKADVGVKIKITEGPQTKIDDIKILTPNKELELLLRRTLKGFRGDPLTDRTIADLRQKSRSTLSENGYWKTDLGEMKVERNFEETSAQISFHLAKYEQFSLETDGRRSISRGDLEEALQLETYSTANPNLAGELASKIKALYLARGFARVEVDGEEHDGSRPYSKKIRLRIQEGPKIAIEKIEFSGPMSQPGSFYVKFLRDHSSSVLRDGFYVKDDLDTGLKNLVTDRWNQGFLKAKLISTRTIYNKDKDKVSLFVQIDEGPLTLVDKLSFSGNLQVPKEALIEVLKLQQGQALRLSHLESALVNLKVFYRDQGFLEMRLENEKEGLVNYNQDNSLAHLHFQIHEGPLVRVAAILVEGNSISQDEVITRELEFSRGDILTPTRIEESTSRLQRLGLFSSVEIKTLEEKTQISDRTVIVRVIDRDPGLFNLGIGVNNERGLTVRGYSGIAYRNLFGTGRGVSARLDGNYNISDVKYLERKITLGYLEPALFHSRLRGRVNLTRAISVSDFDKRQASEVNQTTYSLEQDITSHLLVVWDVWSLATVRDFLIDGNQEVSLLNIASSSLTVDLDYRDHPFNPTKGTFSRLSTEYGSPMLGSTDTIEYTRSMLSFTHYQSLLQSPSIVWANSLRYGYVKNLSSKSNGAVPYDKKGFLLGGQSTLRGFTPDESFPNSKDFGLDRFNLTTAASMQLFKSEIRFPIWGNIGGAVFYDGGQVLIDGQDLQFGWRDSFGIAARYITPVGAVSLEYGWKIKPRGDRSENPSVFHFSIGTF